MSNRVFFRLMNLLTVFALFTCAKSISNADDIVGGPQQAPAYNRLTDGNLLNEFGFGSASNASRVSSLLGNTTGIADWGNGAATNQTLRIVAPSNGIINSQGVPNNSVTVVGGVGPLKKIRPFAFDENDHLYVNTGYRDAFGRSLSVEPISQIIAQFDISLASNDLTGATSGGGSNTQANGLVTIATGTATTASASLTTNRMVRYHPFRGIYAAFTAGLSPPTHANSFSRIGLYDANNGFFLGYSGTTFGFTVRKGGVDTFTPLSSAAMDPLDGSTYSDFTRAGSPEALDLTKENIWLIDFAWLGAAPVKILVFSPDGAFVTAFKIRHPNSLTSPSVNTANLPIKAEVSKSSADATNVTIISSSWDAGIIDSSAGLEPEDTRGRKYTTASAAGVTTDQAVYTVQTGRVLRLTGGNLTCSNSSLTTQGLVQFRDGAGGTVYMPFTTAAATNQAGSTVTVPFTLPTGMRFTSAVYMDFVAGTLTCSFWFTGYEAEN